MKITAQEEYGLRCLLQLARTNPSELVSVKEIALKEGLSHAYVEKLLRLLGKSELVHSVRGVKGGYVLNRPPSQMTLREVVGALGGMKTMDHICHQFTGREDACVHFTDCGIRSAWSGLTTHINRFLEETTLDRLLTGEGAASELIANRLRRF